MHSLFKHIIELEQSLHHSSIRGDIDALRLLIDRDFVEFGYSGRRFTFDSIIEDMQSNEGVHAILWSQEFDAVALCSDLVQLRYKSASIDTDGNMSRYAYRTSLWRRHEQGWKVVFHQATPTSKFSKC